MKRSFECEQFGVRGVNRKTHIILASEGNLTVRDKLTKLKRCTGELLVTVSWATHRLQVKSSAGQI